MFWEEQDSRDSDPPTSLIGRILEFGIVVAVCGYLIKLGGCYFLQVWPVLAIIAGIALGAVIGWKIWRNHRGGHW